MANVVGTKYWDKADAYSQQNNNGEEETLRICLEEAGTKYGFIPRPAEHLEFCGPTAAVNAIDAIRSPFIIKLPGGFVPQSESLLSNYFRDPSNYKLLAAAVGESWFNPSVTPANRVLKAYPLALKAVFGIASRYVAQKPAWSEMPKILKSNSAIVIQLRSPSHYITIKAYDLRTNELIYNDPWNFRGGIHGFNRRMTYSEWQGNTHDHALIVDAGNAK